jgi:transcriptional regulator with XRE-family HTH domain
MNNAELMHGQYIRARREALGLTQSDLARAARLTPAMISRLEAGQRRGRPPALRALAEALRVPAAALLERAGYTAEAQYWREREGDHERPDPLARLPYAVSLLPCRPAVQAALRTLLTELARDQDEAFRERFEQAVSRVTRPTEPDAPRFELLRDLIFEPERVPPTAGS